MFGSRFIGALKEVGEGMQKKKSRLVAQNYSDQDQTRLATRAPTVQRFSQLVITFLAASLNGMYRFTRDVTQAYI